MEPCGPDTASGLGAWLGDVLTGTNAAQTLCDSCTNIECTTDNEDVNSVDWTDFDLEGTIPSIIGSLSKLVSLELGRNQLSGTIPPWIASMSVLTNLELSLNDLTGSLPPALGSAKSIRRLLADANYLTGVVPQSFASLTSMYVVSLGDNQLSSTLPHSWHNLRRLIYLELANGMLSNVMVIAVLPSTATDSQQSTHGDLSGHVRVELVLGAVSGSERGVPTLLGRASRLPNSFDSSSNSLCLLYVWRVDCDAGKSRKTRLLDRCRDTQWGSSRILKYCKCAWQQWWLAATVH